ncbi:MAG: phosphate ABC transporter permease subunit PstC [Alphaproteobacteria bacterium]|nr:MAG: phosphate ABC transporter permease subunit PstC [Alphaproteobacteria bacterium]
MAKYEKLIRATLLSCTMLSVMITVMVVASVFSETMRFFSNVSVFNFFFGTEWSPQTAIRPDQAGGSGTFGAVPVFLGTFLVTLIAMAVAAPLGLFSAIYLSVYASPRFRLWAKPVLEILAGVPSVVYGYFAVITMAPMLREFGETIGLSIASESALTAGTVMGIMITPYVMSISEDVISAVPKSLSMGSLAIGATESETVKKVILPAALPGIVSALLLGVSRGVGETMVVVMAAGMAANLTINPLESVTTATVQIMTLLVGDHEFDSDKTRAAFALGFSLFIMTLILNIVALIIVKKYRERYD